MQIEHRELVAPQGLDSKAVADFERNGFVSVRGLVPPAELTALRDLYDSLFERRAGWDRGDFFDMIDPADKPDQPRLPQLAWPSRHAPWLAEMETRRKAQALAATILGPKAELVWEFAILKPALIGAATPWHQDEASFTVGTPYNLAVSCWIPLQDVDESLGCMLYKPGSHLGPLLPHASVGGDKRAHALEAVAPDTTGMVAVPLSAGDCVLHHSRTLHGAGANTSPTPRRALTLEFAVRDPATTMRRDFEWNRAKWTARDERQATATPLKDRLRNQVRRALIRLGW